jgi:hypothetical protein
MDHFDLNIENCRFALAENGDGNLAYEEEATAILIQERAPH